MSEALDAAHRAGVIHRDFKPSNVMLVAAGGTAGARQPNRVVVTDFGLACRLIASTESTRTVSGRIAGTVDYMAPELFTGGEASVGSDIYALGLVAYKAITGTLPFESRSPLAGVIRRAAEPAPSVCAQVPGLASSWDRALARALDVNPARRFDTARKFANAIAGESDSVTLKIPAITRRRVASAAAGAALLLAAPFAWRAWERARARPTPEAEALYCQGAADLHAGANFAATKAFGQAIAVAPRFTLAHARLAEAWANLDFIEKASYEMLLARRQDLSELSRSDQLQVEAIDLTITREFAAAAKKYEEMLNIAGTAAADLYLDLGRAYENAGNPGKAIESYRKAADGSNHNPAAWLALGVVYSRSGDTTKAEAAFQQSEQLYRMGNNLEGLTELAYQRGVAASTHDELERSKAYLSSALETARLAGNNEQEIRVTLRLSSNAYVLGDVQLAERYAREALETARLNRIDALAARGLINLGLAYSRKGDSAGAERYARQALEVARSGNAPRLVALALLSLAALHDTGARYKEAEREAAEALSFYQPNRFSKESFQCLTILGRARLRAEDYASALDFFQRASSAAQLTNDRALAEESMGSVLSAQQRYPEALPHFQKEFELSSSAERRGYALLNVGEMMWVTGMYEKAKETFTAADAVASPFPSLRLSLLRARALMELSRDHYAEAQALARRGLALDTGLDPRLHSDLNGVLGLALASTGQTTKGIQLCRESLKSAKAVGQSANIVLMRLNLGLALLLANDRSGALTNLEGHEPDFAKYPESRWQTLAVMSRADSRHTESAREALKNLEQLWGADAFREYVTRPDVNRISRPLLQSVSAIQPQRRN